MLSEFSCTCCDDLQQIKPLRCRPDTSPRVRSLPTSACQLTQAGLRRMTASLTQVDRTKPHWGAPNRINFLKLRRGRSELIYPALCLDAAPAASSKRALWRAARRHCVLSVPLKGPDPPHSPLSPPTEEQRRGFPFTDTWKTTSSHFASCSTSPRVPLPLFYTSFQIAYSLQTGTHLSINYSHQNQTLFNALTLQTSLCKYVYSSVLTFGSQLHNCKF